MYFILLKETTTGILLQGDIRSWTIPIIEEHQKNFPDSEIVLSTWDNEDVSNIPCKVIKNKIQLYTEPFYYFILLWAKNNINRLSAFVNLPLGFLRYIQPNKWQKAMTCNLGIWKNDFIRINGFDEVFEGWGYEDSDLVIRLIHSGIKRKEGRFAVQVLHLWHSQNDKSNHDLNYQRLMVRLEDPEFIFAKKGVSHYLG